MSAGELIKRLQEFDPDMPVTIPGSGPTEGQKVRISKVTKAAVAQPQPGASHFPAPPARSDQTLVLVVHLS